MSVTVRRVGNLNQYAIVLCRTEQGTATSSSGSRPGEQDYMEYAGQVGRRHGDRGALTTHAGHQAWMNDLIKTQRSVSFRKPCGPSAFRRGSFRALCKESSPLAVFQVQFEEREDTKACTIVINDDDVFESTESFTVELSMPAYALLGNVTRATVTITDTEDEPTLQFDRKTYHVSESDGFLSAPVERKGGSSRAGRLAGLCGTGGTGFCGHCAGWDIEGPHLHDLGSSGACGQR